MEDQQRTLHVCCHVSLILYFNRQICPKQTCPVTTSLFHQHYKTDSVDRPLPCCHPSSPLHPHPCSAPCSLPAPESCSRWTAVCSLMFWNRAWSQRPRSFCCLAGSVKFEKKAGSCFAPSLGLGRGCEPFGPVRGVDPAAFPAPVWLLLL